MSDLFHKKIPKAYIDQVFDTMERANWHVFQVLTKRSSLMRDYVNARYGEQSEAPAHIWLGASVEDVPQKSRINHIRDMRAATRFLSLEPLIADLGTLDLRGIHWVIVGGESGPGYRPMDEDWVVSIRDQCHAQHVAFFFKQWGGLRPKSGGRQLHGELYNGFPDIYAINTCFPS